MFETVSCTEVVVLYILKAVQCLSDLKPNNSELKLRRSFVWMTEQESGETYLSSPLPPSSRSPSPRRALSLTASARWLVSHSYTHLAAMGHRPEGTFETMNESLSTKSSTSRSIELPYKSFHNLTFIGGTIIMRFRFTIDSLLTDRTIISHYGLVIYHGYATDLRIFLQVLIWLLRHPCWPLTLLRTVTLVSSPMIHHLLFGLRSCAVVHLYCLVVVPSMHIDSSV